MNRYILLLLLTLLLSSCSLIYDEPGDTRVDSGSDRIVLSFTVNSPMLQSRTDVAGHPEVESDYREFENGVDPDDLVIFVFAKVEGSDMSEKLVGNFTPFTKKSGDPQNRYTDADMMLVGGIGSYIVHLSFIRADFNDKLGLTGNENDQIAFRVLMLTSSSTQGTSQGSLNTRKWDISSITDPTYEAILSQFSSYDYQMEYIYNRRVSIENSSPSVAQLYPNPGKVYNGQNESKNDGRLYMPMFGTNTFTVPYTSLVESSAVNRVNLGGLDLLRSLAKIRVVDNIQTKNADGYPKVVSASIIGDQESIRLLPNNAETYINGNQVHSPNSAVPGSTVTTEFKLGYFPDNWPIIPAVTHTGSVFVGYCPEQSIHPLESETSYPIIRITVALSADAAGTETTRDYEVPMAGYAGASFENTFGNAILRNHIYTLSVDGIGAATDAVITANIFPWDTISFELNYTDIVNHEPVVWDSDSYESINKNTIYLTPWGQNIDGQPELVPLKGRKKITLPTGATWTAFLLNNGDDSSAIGFVDQTGIPSLKQISGDYQDTEIVFNIGSNQVDPGDNRNSAILQLVVVLPNGNVYEVPLSSEYATYTIVQNPQ